MSRYTLCPTCRIGTLRETNTTFVRQLGANLVSVPNVLTWNCDMCGEVIYDEETIARLEVLMGPEASFGDRPRTRTRQRPTDARSRDLRSWT